METGRTVAQATLRLSSELECERAVRLAHRRGVASATAYRGPETDAAHHVFLMLIDEEEVLAEVLQELRGLLPGASISVSHEAVVHEAPEGFLRGAALRPRPFRVGIENLGWVFAGGALGAGARLATEEAARRLTPEAYSAFPWGTLTANVVGSFFIAIFGTLIFERFVGERARMFWVLGFLGSLTTFSSYAAHTMRGWEASPLLGGLYGGGSVLLGLLAALGGFWISRRFL
ncbi:Putative fluoride ion transporter CrcB [Rubrobacter xylanophilus DSM 9941]|uniref:CrcB family protein n=1 Tax=Rubrobacter xylanophilus TaxID=49319 RepID=UPI001C63BB6E|nr:CrcB family protein [Rubrobacter xylanophilus]QYJ16749.1 Putative fluoride ion transporter CrcB [Rubrobacter xylanophilus DSM 9941]